MAKKEQVKALRERMKPSISLTEKDIDGIKNLKIDDEVKLEIVAKVTGIGKSPDFDIAMPDEPMSAPRPKILNARFELTTIKKV